MPVTLQELDNPEVFRRESQQAIQNWKSNPELFHSSLFKGRLWSKQIEIFEAVQNYDRVAVRSGNTIGKSRITAEIALHWLLTRYPSKVITTAPTFNQVENILWKEIATLYHSSKVPIGGKLLDTFLEMEDDWFALGISTDEVNRFQGFHSPHLLVLVDEALGVDSVIWEAIIGLHPERVLVIGNPLSPEGEFFKCFRSPLWHKIVISCQECVDWQNENGIIPGLVDQKWIDERKTEWGVKSPLFQGRVTAEFPQEGTDTLVHLNWVDRCRSIDIEEDEDEEDSLKIVASDVARFGEDKTVLMYRYGHTLVEGEIKQKIPTTMTAGIIKQWYEKKKADNLVVDDVGVGGGVVDMIVEQKIGVLGFNAGSKEIAIDKNHFRNLRSQFYWIVARKFEKSLYSLKRLPQPIYDLLKSQLCSIKYRIESDGRINVESKDDMKARGLVSPDVADTFVMTEYGYVMGKQADIKAYRWR